MEYTYVYVYINQNLCKMYSRLSHKFNETARCADCEVQNVLACVVQDKQCMHEMHSFSWRPHPPSVYIT